MKNKSKLAEKAKIDINLIYKTHDGRMVRILNTPGHIIRAFVYTNTFGWKLCRFRIKDFYNMLELY